MAKESELIKINAKRVDMILEKLKGKRILVLGDVMLDKYLRGRVHRLSPEAPVPVVELESETYHFGGAANVAFNLKTLGCEPITIGLVGSDAYGDIFYSLFEEQKLNTAGLIKAQDRPTTVKTRIIGDNQHLARVDREKVIYVHSELSEQIKKSIERFIDRSEALLIEDYNKGVLSQEVIAYALKAAQDRGIITAVDPKFVNFLKYKGVSVFKPNLKEVSQALARPLQSDAEVIAAGKELRHMLSAKCVLLTRGAKGLSLFEESGINHVSTKTRSVADVSGAGDTVISTMTAVLTTGAGFREAAQIANFAAGIVCEQVGIVAVHAAELRAAIVNEAQE